MINKKNPFSDLLSLAEIMANGEKNLAKVNRWQDKNFVSEKAESQTTLQHSFSINLLAMDFIDLLRPYNPELDGELIIRTCLLHDWSEGENGCDKPAPEKTIDDDLSEYLAFVKRFISRRNFDYLHRDFMLQYVCNFNKVIGCNKFPKYATDTLFELLKNNSIEGKVFRIIEIWEYLAYSLRQYYVYGNKKIIKEVIERNFTVINEYTKAIRGFREEIYTREVELALCELMKEL